MAPQSPPRASGPPPPTVEPDDNAPLFLFAGSSSSSDSGDSGDLLSIPAPPTTNSHVQVGSEPPRPDPAAEASSKSPPKPKGKEKASIDEEDDDDPVVAEYDIEITSELAQYLHLIQYSVRPRDKPYSAAANCRPIEARLKPKSGMLEVDIPINTSRNYDQEKGRAWGGAMRKASAAKEAGLAGKAMGVAAGSSKRRAGPDDDEEDEYLDFDQAVKAERVLKHLTLGGRMQPDLCSYMIGVFKDEKLHLTPIKQTLQLSPQFHHIDAASEQERATTRALRDAALPPKPQEARAVHLTVKNSDDPNSQLSPTMRALRLMEEEEWKKVTWVDQDEDLAWETYGKLSLPEGSQKMATETPAGDYIQIMMGKVPKPKGEVK